VESCSEHADTYRVGNVTSWDTISFQRRNLLHGHSSLRNDKSLRRKSATSKIQLQLDSPAHWNTIFEVLTVASIETRTLWHVIPHPLVDTKVHGVTSQKIKILFNQNQFRTSWKILRISWELQ